MSERRIIRDTLKVHLSGTELGIGLRIVGGKKRGQQCGIFIKELIKGKLASQNGELEVGDQLLSVNSVNLEGVSIESALDIMKRSAQSGEIDLLIARDKEAREHFKRLSNSFSPNQSATEDSNKSDLTDVSDITEDSEDLLDTRPKIPVKVELHDVRLSVNSSNLSDESAVPPPLPSSLPPGDEISTSSIPSSSSTKRSVESKNGGLHRPHADGLTSLPPPNKSHPAQEVPLSQTTTPIYSTIDNEKITAKEPSSCAIKPRQQRLSVIPSDRFNLEKLLWALEYVGTTLTGKQLDTLHERLQIDGNGKVVFSEFLEIVQQFIPSKLDQKKLLEAFSKPSLLVAEPQKLIVSKEVESPKERNEGLIKENKKLRNEISRLNLKLEDEQKKNIALIKSDATLKNLAAKECELRKMEVSNRRYQVAVDILQKFVEDCHEALVKSKRNNGIEYIPHGTGSPAIRGDQLTGNPRPPQYLSKHTKKTAITLANDAKKALAEVRRIMTVQELPFGWEEEYTKEGTKYYVNHVTQTTSWVHPVTKQHPSPAKKLPKEAKEK